MATFESGWRHFQVSLGRVWAGRGGIQQIFKRRRLKCHHLKCRPPPKLSHPQSVAASKCRHLKSHYHNMPPSQMPPFQNVAASERCLHKCRHLKCYHLRMSPPQSAVAVPQSSHLRMSPRQNVATTECRRLKVSPAHCHNVVMQGHRHLKMSPVAQYDTLREKFSDAS